MLGLRQFYEKLFGIEDPWQVSKVELSERDKGLTVKICHHGSELMCPHCGKSGMGNPQCGDTESYQQSC